MLRVLRDRIHGERGSLPMALLAIMVISAVVAVVTAGVVAGSRQTAFDSSYEGSLQTAEFGADTFISMVKNSLTSTIPACAYTAPAVEARCLPATSGANGMYEVRGERDGNGNWTVVSKGTVADVKRTVRIRLERQQPFRHAMFGDRHVTFTGYARQAQSFDSTTGTWSTGNATLATNAPAIVYDSAVVFDGKPGTGNANVDVASDDAVAFINDALQTCADNGTHNVLPASPIPPGDYCVDALSFNGVVELDPAATIDTPVRIFVTTSISFGRASVVNCGVDAVRCVWGASAPNLPNPGALQIYSIGQQQTTFGTDAKLSAAIFAPRSHCLSTPHAQIFGSVVCRTAGSFTGHFRLYYDDALKRVFGPERKIWSEEQSV